MKELIQAMGNWGVPTVIITSALIIFIIMQVLGEIITFKGKIVPEFMNVRKALKKKKEEKRKLIEQITRIDNKLNTVEAKLNDFEQHYSNDNIDKRNEWMHTIEERGEKRDEVIQELVKSLDAVIKTLEENTKMTEEMFIQNSRTIILNFASMVGRNDTVLSKEEFNRVFKVYNKYEKFLESKGRTNGEIDTAYSVIEEGYKVRLKEKSFLEDIRK